MVHVGWRESTSICFTEEKVVWHLGHSNFFGAANSRLHMYSKIQEEHPSSTWVVAGLDLHRKSSSKNSVHGQSRSALAEEKLVLGTEATSHRRMHNCISCLHPDAKLHSASQTQLSYLLYCSPFPSCSHFT